MAYSQFSFILWIVICHFVCSWQAVEVKSPVFARVGESVVLPCTYSTQASEGFTLEWSYAPPGTPALQAKRIVYYNGKLYWVNTWGGRMTLVQEPPASGTASVRIYNVQPSDAGLYICDITNPSDWSRSGQGLINFTVLMPPSVPVCQRSGSAFVGNDVTLTCLSSQGLPKPIYYWNREKTAAPLPPEQMVLDQSAGSLILRNLSTAFSGTYTCRASNELGQAECSVVLRVSFPSTAAVVGGVVIGIFFLLLLIGAAAAYFLWYRKRSAKRRQEQNDIDMNSTLEQPAVVSNDKLISTSSDNEEDHDLKVSKFSPLV
ncbi:V-set and immunoglobulin domain-containing protein 2-like [Chanos chanos]|uniref:V-set and immunoglobulin domain-containing protein 2-like n=1 Tax=Chanos chanos TaxID=29144 RepID=UPI0011F143F9|nr:V-set and immunoglobulin domain-containing protein 2 [Chanos chanos]